MCTCTVYIQNIALLNEFSITAAMHTELLKGLDFIERKQNAWSNIFLISLNITQQGSQDTVQPRILDGNF